LAGHATVVRLLLERGADVNAREREKGATPLHLAASWGRSEVVLVLLEHGADVNARNHAGQTPLAVALENNQEEAAALLRARGAR
jgi:ankyrin repeat protein